MASSSGSKDGKAPPPVAPKPKGAVPGKDAELKLKAMMGNWTLADRDLDDDEISQDPKLQAIFWKSKEIDFADDEDKQQGNATRKTGDEFQDFRASRSVFEKAKGFQNGNSEPNSNKSEKHREIEVNSERKVQDLAKGVLANKDNRIVSDKKGKEEFVTSRNVLQTARRMQLGESESEIINKSDGNKIDVKASRSVLNRARDILEGKYENEIVSGELENRIDVKASRNVRDVARDAEEGKLSNVDVIKTEVDVKASRKVTDVAHDAEEGRLSNVDIIRTEVDAKASRKVTDVAQDAEEGRLSNVDIIKTEIDAKASRKVTEVAHDAEEGRLSNVDIIRTAVDAKASRNVIDSAKTFENNKNDNENLNKGGVLFETSRNVKETAKHMLEGKYENELVEGEIENRIDVKASRNVSDVAKDVEEGKLNNAEEMVIENRIDVKASRNVKEVANEIDDEVTEFEEQVRLEKEAKQKKVNLAGSVMEEENDIQCEDDETEVNQLASACDVNSVNVNPINDDTPSREGSDGFGGRNAGLISNFGNMYFDSHEESEKHAPIMIMGFSDKAIIGHETFEKPNETSYIASNVTGYDALGPEQEREIAQIINNVLAGSGRSLIAEEKLQRVAEAEDRIPYIGLAIGLVLGMLVAVCDEIVPQVPSLSIYLKVPFVCVFVLMGYGFARVYKNILATQREGLLDPPIDLLAELNPSEVNNAQNGNSPPSGKSHGSAAAARKRYRKGKS